MKTTFKRANNLKIKEIIYSQKFGTMVDFENNDNSVRIIKKAGRTELTCTCYQGTKFCNNISLCHHRIASIVNMFCKENGLKLVKK